jgi:hypothetical protein
MPMPLASLLSRRPKLRFWSDELAEAKETIARSSKPLDRSLARN